MAEKVEIDLLYKQGEAWNAWEDPLITELGYGGAAGGGKTRLGWYMVITLCEAYADAKVVVGRKELKTLRLTTLEELWLIFRENSYVEGIDYKFNAMDNIVTFASGSEVLLLDTAFSPKDPEYTRFGSLPVTFAWVDESNETPEKAISILKTRVGRANNLHKVVEGVDGEKTISEESYQVKGFWLETFNPNKGHVYRTYYKAWKEKTLPEYRMFIRALPGDNPHLSAAYIQNLNRSDKTTRERLLKGNFEFDDDPQKLMIYDAITDLPNNVLLGMTKVLPNGEIVADKVRSEMKYIIADVARFGGDKIVIGTFKGMELYSLGVYTYQGTDETVRQIKQESIDEQVAFKNILADEDGIGGGVVDNMRGIKGFTGNASPTLVWDLLHSKQIPANFQNFRSQSYFKLADLVNDRLIAVRITKFNTNIEGYTLESALSELMEELDAIKRTSNSEDGKQAVIPKTEIKEQLGRSPDFADILMMRMFYELKDIQEEEVAQSVYTGQRQERANPAR